MPSNPNKQIERGIYKKRKMGRKVKTSLEEKNEGVEWKERKLEKWVTYHKKRKEG